MSANLFGLGITGGLSLSGVKPCTLGPLSSRRWMDSGSSAGASTALQFHGQRFQQGRHASSREDGWRGWMLGGVWINEGHLVTDGATSVDGCFNFSLPLYILPILFIRPQHKNSFASLLFPFFPLGLSTFFLTVTSCKCKIGPF